MSLSSFSPPGFVEDLTPAGLSAWSADVSEIVAAQADADKQPQFFNPLTTELADDQTTKAMRWGAFPRKLAREVGQQRWRRGEERNRQEEYCEWSAVLDRHGSMVRACFTTETPEYFVRLANDNPDELVRVYREHVSPRVQKRDLISLTGSYIPDNQWNRLGAMHLIQGNNTLRAALVLAAQATVVRTKAGQILTNSADLIRCGVAADADRNSDPLIIAEVNKLARTGAHISLADPIGLYIDSLQTTGWHAPGGADPASFWTVTRGATGHGVRAVYEVPPEAGFTIGDVTINGAAITSPSQIAEHVQITLVGLAHRIGTAAPLTRMCRAGQGTLEAAADSPPSLTDLQAAARGRRA